MEHDLSQKFSKNSVFALKKKVISEYFLPHLTSVLTQTLAKSIRLTRRAVVRLSNLPLSRNLTLCLPRRFRHSIAESLKIKFPVLRLI